MTHADITLVNLNMLYVRYADGRTEREKHLPLGPLYLAAALERAGFTVDFSDYQTHVCADPFRPETIAAYLADSARVLGVSCMANLLPFTLMALQEFKARHPDRVIVLGGVGSKSVERLLLERCPWVDVIARGESEISGPLQAVRMESYEVANGMRPLWVGLEEAIAHNRGVMQRREQTMGLSIQRETLMLEHVRRLRERPMKRTG